MSVKESSRRHFDRWSRRYESDAVSKRLATLQRAALDALELVPGDRLLDVGCGTGAAVREAASTVERAVGVDLSEGMIERGRELAAGMPNMELLEADSESLPFDHDAFTALLCTTSMHHYPRADAAMAEFARVLAPSGRVVIGDWTTDKLALRAFDLVLRAFQRSHMRMRRTSEIERLLTGAGLELERTQMLEGGAYAVVRARKA